MTEQKTPQQYIVKNCPAYLFHDICSQAGEYDRSCSDCNDCEVKQVINRCLAKRNTIMQNFVISILEMFDIEVVKNG